MMSCMLPRGKIISLGINRHIMLDGSIAMSNQPGSNRLGCGHKIVVPTPIAAVKVDDMQVNNIINARKATLFDNLGSHVSSLFRLSILSKSINTIHLFKFG